MQPGNDLSDRAIFTDVSDVIRKAIEATHARNSSSLHFTRTAFEIALERLN